MIWFQKRWLICTHLYVYKAKKRRRKIEKWNITNEKKAHYRGLVIDDNWLQAEETHWSITVQTYIRSIVLSPLPAKSTRGHLEEPCFARLPGWLKWKQLINRQNKAHKLALNSYTSPTCGPCTIWPDWLDLELFAPKWPAYSSISLRYGLMHVKLTVCEGGHQQDRNRVQQPAMDDHFRSSSN